MTVTTMSFEVVCHGSDHFNRRRLPIWLQLNDGVTRKKMIRREKRLKTSSDDVLTKGGGDTRDDDGDQQLDMFKVV